MFMLGEGWVLTSAVFFMSAQAVDTVPVKVQAGSILTDVVRVLSIKAPIIVLGIIHTMFPGTTVVTRYTGLIFHRFTSFILLLG